MGQFRILFATDDARGADGMRAALAAHSELALDIVDSAAACRARLGGDARTCDLLLVDQALFAELRDVAHPVPTIVLIAAGDDALAVRVLEAGALDFIVKTADYLGAVPARIAGARVRIAREPLYRRIVDGTDEGIWVIDASAATTFVNPRMARMLGYTVDEMLGRTLFDFMDDEGRAITTRNLERRRDGIAEPHEFVFRRRDGSPLYALLTTNPIHDDGHYAGALALVHDIGERRQSDLQLLATEERFRSLFEHSPICLWEEDGSVLKAHLDQLRAHGVTDMRAYFRAHPEEVGRCFAMVKVIDVNEAAVRHYGARDKAELVDGLARTLVADALPVLTEELIQLADGAMVFEAETVDQTFAGRRNHILLKTLVAPGSEHTFSRVYVSMVDITARKQAEERMRELASFPELDPNAVLDLASDGAIAYANPAAEALARARGATLAELLPHDIAAIVGECLATSRPRTQLETRHGTHTLAWSFHPVPVKQTVHCYAADITERLHLEEQLRQSQKMDAIGHLAGGVAHDFNNLLTVIHGNTVLLQRQRPSTELRAEALDYIATATARAATLVRQLLAFSRQQVLQPRELDLNVAVVNIVKMLERVVREDVEVKLELASHALHARADAVMLDQVVMNLVVNARDAMPNGGSIVLETSRLVLTDDESHGFPNLRRGAYACLRVTDTGEGIAPEHLARVFEPFFTTKALGKGTGLGLATAFGIVKQHGGALGVESELGRGTTFRVLLPMAKELAPAAFAETELEPAGGAESILVVEDEEPVRRLVQQVLEMQGYRVHVVSTGADALALSGGPRFDLVLTDVIMPGGVSGRELADRLRTTQPGLKVIYMSGYTGELAGRGLELREGVNFLQKPFGPTPLLACIRGSLDRR